MEDHGHKTHFTLFGVPVHVGVWFFVWPVLTVLGQNRTALGIVEYIAVVFLAIMIHELGHAYVYRRYGSPARIELWSLGGLTFGQRLQTRGQQALVSLAGPVPPLIFIGIPSYFVYRNLPGYDPFWSQTLFDIWQVTLFWSVINLLPMLPLDGGRLFDTWYGRRPARIASIATGIAAFVFFLANPVFRSFNLALLGLIMAGFNAYVMHKEKALDMTMVSGYMDMPGGMQIGRPIETAAGRPSRKEKKAAEQKAKAWQATKPVLSGAVLAREGKANAAVAAYATGISRHAWVPPIADRILAETGLAPQVADWLLSTDPYTGRQMLDRIVERFRGRSYFPAAAEINEVLAGSAGFDEAGRHWYGAACDWSNADEHDRALAALKHSIDAGFADAGMVALEPSFAPLQDDPGLTRLFGAG
jgi:stage IV sporulation protein FB